MTYARIDDNFPEHPKVRARSLAARWVHLRAICYASRLLTDGFVPAESATEWGRGAARELVEAGMWEAVDGGFQIVGYLDHNDSRAQVEERRAKDAERKRRGRDSGVDSEQDSDRTPSGVPRGIRRDSPSGDVEEFQGSSASKSGTIPPGVGTAFEDFWAAYPLHDDPRRAQKAFAAALQRAPVEDIIAGAERYRDDPNRDPEFTKLAVSWLEADAWANGPLPDRNGPRPSRHPLDQIAARAMGSR